jgi:hypothetical protein
MAKAGNFDPLSKDLPIDIRKFKREKEKNGNNFAMQRFAETKFEQERKLAN